MARKPNNPNNPVPTPAELKIVGLIKRGHCSKQIAAMLGNSTQTINNTRSRMLKKFNVQNSAQLTHHLTQFLQE